MRYSIFCFIFGLYCTGICTFQEMYAHFPCRRYEYLLKVQHPAGMAISEPWVGYYRGACLPFRGNLAILTQRAMRFAFSVLITPAVDQYACDVISHMPILVRDLSMPFKWFDLELMMQDHEWSWKITELPSAEAPWRLPDHTIVFLFDPRLVTLRAPVRAKYKKDTTHEGGCALIEFPTLVIHGSAQEIEQSASRVQCSSISTRAIHESPLSEDRIVEGCCCTLLQ